MDQFLKDAYLPRIRAGLYRRRLCMNGCPCRAFALAWRAEAVRLVDPCTSSSLDFPNDSHKVPHDA